MSRVYLKCQLKHLPLCVLIKVYRLDSALMGGQNSDVGRAQNENLRKKGGHLIRSGIKRFVTVEAEERGRAGG